jgi:uncharacterized protein (TIGR00730 family)
MKEIREIRQVCVYCASSNQVDKTYHDAAFLLGQILARAGITVIYGGGGIGSMGRLADGVLSEKGTIIGVLPNFMAQIQWGHKGLSELILVDDLHGRKRIMLEKADAVIALPGGTGTFEELLEAITLKQLGIYLNPIVLVDTNRFFRHFAQLLKACVQERFMDPRHLAMWQRVDRPEEVLAAIADATAWDTSARNFATLK